MAGTTADTRFFEERQKAPEAAGYVSTVKITEPERPRVNPYNMKTVFRVCIIFGNQKRNPNRERPRSRKNVSKKIMKLSDENRKKFEGEFPKGKKYSIIYSDPPWAYRDCRDRVF